MMRKTGWLLGVMAAFVAFGMAAPPAFAACDGCTVHGNHFFSDGEKIDLAELGDGETRFFEAGDRQVVATRYGDTVELTIEDPDGEDTTIECDVTRDGCFVILPEGGEDARVMIVKTRTSGTALDGEIAVHLEAIDGKHLLHGDGETTFAVMVSMPEGDHEWISEHGSRLMVENLRFEGGTTLRCPEGDTTMRLGPDDEDEGPFRCPKHDLELEKVAGRVMVKEIRVQKPHEDH